MAYVFDLCCHFCSFFVVVYLKSKVPPRLNEWQSWSYLLSSWPSTWHIGLSCLSSILTAVRQVKTNICRYFIGIKEEYNCLENVSLDFNQLSSVDPFILVQAMTSVLKMTLWNTELTPQQVEAIFDALEEPGRLQVLKLTGNNLSFVDPAKMSRVNALQQIIMCHTKLTMKQVISIAEGSVACPNLKLVIVESMTKECPKNARRMYRATNRQFPKLKRIRWTDEELDGTAEEWENLRELFSRAASRGIHIFQDAGNCQCPCTCAF